MPIYIVKNGDSVYQIAQQFRVSPEWIIAVNELKEPDELIVGQSLVIPIYALTHTVKEGDTLSQIAARFSTDVRSLLQKNPQLAGKDTLYPEETLVIFYRNEPQEELSVNGYAYPFVDSDILCRTLPYLTHLTVFTYGFTENGTLIEADDQAVLQLAAEYGVTPILLLSTLTQEGTFDNRLSSVLLNDSKVQSNLIDNLITTMRQKGYVAVDIDFEYLLAQDKDAYADFMRLLQSRMQEEGFGTVVSLAPKISEGQAGLLYEGHSYEQLGVIADRSTIMAYEWGYTYGPLTVFRHRFEE